MLVGGFLSKRKGYFECGNRQLRKVIVLSEKERELSFAESGPRLLLTGIIHGLYVSSDTVLHVLELDMKYRTNRGE